MDDAPNTDDPPPLIHVRAAAFGYAGRAVVRVDELALRRGRCLGVFGPNGSGKTTLVRGVTGLLPPLAGTVHREAGPGGRGLRVGYLPQYRGIDPSWPMSGLDAAMLATAAGHPLGWVGRAGRAQVRAAMDRLDVAPLAGRRFDALSGGQQQRLLLAGALAAGPDVLVLDEPTDGLDVRSRAALQAHLRTLSANGLCTVLISHGVEDLLAAADAVAWLRPADAPDGVSHIDLVSPQALAGRILAARDA